MNQKKSDIFPEATLSLLHCPACGGTATLPLELVEVDEAHSFYTTCLKERKALSRLVSVVNGQYTMRKCETCSLEFADPLKAPPSGWYDAAYSLLPLYPADRWEFSEALSRCKKSDLLAEIGCGNGQFLRMCRDARMRAVGFDFSATAVRECNDEGLDACRLDVAGLSDEISAVQDQDWVVAFHVLEHLDRPETLFKMAASLLKLSGRLLVAVPSDRRPARRYGERDFLDQPPHHMTRWTPSSLKAIGARTGWRLASIVYEPMTIKAQLWSISVRLLAYRAILGSRGRLSPSAEVATRALVLPLALMRLLATRPALSAHAMLAEYRRSP
jgi:SAM-dependent methyltransferase